ncbi:hypothetical protein GCM10010420_42640 [Streptomyces glaucosporus]|uniref:Prephenate dehydrogenase nucleotide-binding domain-containing protein n=1 Tax=Streptomyces glaucosporus TaxID=284044 RepID=A0ABN3IQH4_9ACTN
MTSTRIRSAAVIGCGPAGTSVALALTGAGVRVLLADPDPRAVERAAGAGAGVPLTRGAPPADAVVVAAPPSTAAEVLYTAQLLGLGRAYTTVTDGGEDGGKDAVLVREEALLRGCDLNGYVPGRLLAHGQGRAAAGGGPLAGRPWILNPWPTVPPEAVAAVRELVVLCGAILLEPDPDGTGAAAPAVPQSRRCPAGTPV